MMTDSKWIDALSDADLKSVRYFLPFYIDISTYRQNNILTPFDLWE